MNSSPTPTLEYSARNPDRTILVTGASGYVGGRLIPELLAAGFSVRATSRNIKRFDRFPWKDDVELAEADLGEAADVSRIMQGVNVAFYLVHSMGDKGEDFEETEQKSAEIFVDAADNAEVDQIVYLSGLHPRNKPLDDLSKHMRSRERVARSFLAAQTPAVVFRAATLIGSGSASFEIIRHLTQRLPVMVAPGWISNSIEPIAIRDALYYLVCAADLDSAVNQQCDIGCGTTYRFADLLHIYGQSQGLKRRIYSLPIPLPMDKLSGGWIGLVTPVPARLAVPLAQSMAENAITEEHGIAKIIPDPPGGLIDYPRAVKLAVQAKDARGVPTSWDQSWTKFGNSANALATDPDWAGDSLYEDVRSAHSSLSPEDIWRVVEGIGGDNGWYSAPLLWGIRGFMDKIFGGPGLGGRRDPHRLEIGDRVDWWRVAQLERPHRLILKAEMKIDGEAWLTFDVQANDNSCTYTQRASYSPTGLSGRIYWRSMAPFHAFIFPAMMRSILNTAEKSAHDGRK